MNKFDVPKTLPYICVSDVLLPGASMKIPVSSRNAEIASYYLMKHSDDDVSAFIGVVPYKSREDLQVSEHTIGTAAIVVQVLSNGWPTKSFTLTVFGVSRIKINRLIPESIFPAAEVSVLDQTLEDHPRDESQGVRENFMKSSGRLLDFLQSYTPFFGKIKALLESLPDFVLVDFCASITVASIEEKWDILKTLDMNDRMKKVVALIDRHLLEMEDKDYGIFSKKALPIMKIVRSLPATRKKLDEEPDELEEKLKKVELPEAAATVVKREMSRLKRMSPYHADHSVQRHYLELVIDLPWDKRSSENINVIKAKEELDIDHYGMEKVKTRVIEFLAVRQLKSGLKGPILCFVGPPGVGKTSIGRSIAAILGRKFHRISLGGICHESEIRGHRRTYVGAMPGRIIQALRTVSVKNPVILFDEIDKLSGGVNGDPSAALLEVLDPEQNCNFVDHYLNMQFDLSEVLFIATANSTKNISPPLLDRMEVIPVSGYTLDEKKNIAQKHLFPKQLKEHGLNQTSINIPEDVMTRLITGYTREAGVRTLERKLAAICRHTAVIIASKLSEKSPKDAQEQPQTDLVRDLQQVLEVDHDALQTILGPAMYEWDGDFVKGVPGVALGLCWNQSGGDVMMVEASKVPGGSKDPIMTGQLGSVMKESATLALHWVRSVSSRYGLIAEGEDVTESFDVHIHFPAGAVTKEGPSAGITIAVALLSLFSGIPVPPDLAMTGELTLQGLVYPVGGIKEKVISAHRRGIKRIILPSKCQNSMSEIPSYILDALNIIFVRNMDQVIDVTFDGELKPKSAALTSKL